MGRVSAKVPIRKLAATDDVYNRGFHKGDPGGLDAVDTDLAVGNIKDGETIFGKLGTFAGGPLVEDVLGHGIPGDEAHTSGTHGRNSHSIVSGADWNAATTTPAFAAGSRAVGVAVGRGNSGTGTSLKIRVLMGGVQVAESAFVGFSVEWYIVKGTRALAGAQSVICQVHNYGGGADSFRSYGTVDNAPPALAVVTGSIKI